MSKYMLTIQHEEQKVALIHFSAENDVNAMVIGKNLFSNYKKEKNFVKVFPNDGNFSGPKPKIKHHRVSKLVYDGVSVNAWGMFCGDHWQDIE